VPRYRFYNNSAHRSGKKIRLVWCGTAQTGQMLTIILSLHFCQENNMKSTHSIAAVIVAGTAVLSGCASTSSTPYDSRYDTGSYGNAGYNTNVSSGYGTIDSIQVVRGSASTSGTGAVVGGLVGALAGNQVGSGSGRTAATVAGGVAGAAIGNSVEANRNAAGADLYQINIRLDNGEYRSITQDSVYDLRVGNRVRLVDGRVYRY
jgi:outer membrane lipoprotein SlyB